MPKNTKTLSKLRTLIRQRADMENSTFVTDDEIVGFINQSIAELHDELITLYENFYLSSEALTLPADSPKTLPDDFYKCLGVDLNTSGMTYRLKPFQLGERNTYSNPAYSVSGAPILFYSIQGNELKFMPETTVSATGTLWYAPEPQQFALGAGDDDIELNAKARQIAIGYEEYIILDGAIKCLIKEESDYSTLVALKEQQRQRIVASAARRDAGEPYRVQDVRSGTLQTNYVNW